MSEDGKELDMDFEISGRVQEAGTHEGVAGVIVSAFDKDLYFDDLLGEVMTDLAGSFHIRYDESAFRDLFESEPDIYLTIKTTAGQVLHTSKDAVRFNATPHEEFQIEIPPGVLQAVGLRAGQPIGAISEETLTTLTCLENLAEEDDTVKQIRADLSGKASILEMMRDYMAALEKSWDNNAAPFRKMARLFELGKTFERLNGHYYGVAPGLRTGDLEGLAADYGNLMGFIWGSAVVGQCPWGGKSYKPMTDGDRAQVVGKTVPEDVPVLRGINHFNRIEHAPVNIAATSLLTFMWHLQDAPIEERLKYGYELNGGHFAAHRAKSFA
jgi:hypothetical protein